MDIVIGFLIGVAIGGAVVFLVARNNQKKFNEALNIDPKARAKKALAELKRRIDH